MFERFGRSWKLVKASGAVLMQDRDLIVFPAISGVAVFVVSLCFLFPALGLGALDGLRDDGQLSTAGYVIAFLFYVSQYFVIFFFNSALVGAVMIRLDGGNPTLRDGLKIAASKLYPILGYAVIAATVGMVLRIIQERVGFIGQIVVGLIGLGWTLATYLVVPVLVARDVGPLEAVKESATLFKDTWGENVIGQGGLGIAFSFIHFGVILCGVLLMMMAAMLHSAGLVVMMGVITVGALVMSALIHSALSGIYSAALYRHASGSGGMQGFNAEVLQSAFVPK
ncbi:MAG: DUF6159 family protein [Betaproteobacteria bacterium]|nr:DUF6159 family protein [Betaproteobacteria bacterium]